MQGVSSVKVVLVAATLVVACDKSPGASAAPAASGPAVAASTVAAPVASTAAAGAPLAGLDPCLVGSWKSTGFSLKTDQVSAEGGANLAMTIQPAGDAVVDFGPMSPVQGKGAGASFDFQYSGKASAKLSTPTRGSIASSSADYGSLKVTASVELPGAGKVPLFKAKPVAELAQVAAGVVGAKAPVRTSPPGIDASPIFSTTHYSCEGSNLTLDGSDKLAAKWQFTKQ